jgi:hypothetical protein
MAIRSVFTPLICTQIPASRNGYKICLYPIDLHTHAELMQQIKHSSSLCCCSLAVLCVSDTKSSAHSNSRTSFGPICIPTKEALPSVKPQIQTRPNNRDQSKLLFSGLSCFEWIPAVCHQSMQCDTTWTNKYYRFFNLPLSSF